MPHELKAYYINSGLLFRALAYVLINEKSYSLDDLQTPDAIDITQLRSLSDLVYIFKNDAEHILYCGTDITPYLKTPLIDQAASILSLNKTVRSIVRDWQHSIAAKHDVIVDGRDTGSIVFPAATYKFYVTADVKERAQRWQCDQKMRGNKVTIEEAQKEIIARDERDSQRTLDPLIIPEGAHIIDTTTLTKQETLKRILNYIDNQ